MHTASLLQSIPYFQHLPLAELEAYAAQSELVHLRCGDVLMHQGEPGENAFILLDGRLHSTVASPYGGETVIGEIGRGEIVGESAILLGKKRAATVKALRHSILMKIDQPGLMELVRSRSDSLLAFTRTVVQRADATFAYRQQVSTVLLFPVSEGTDMEQFAHGLASGMQAFGSFQPLSYQQLREKAGAAAETGPDEMVHLLAAHESENPEVIYVSDGRWDAWTEACCRRVDRILLVGNAERFRPVGADERSMVAALKESNLIRTELVLIHPSRANLPRDTNRWFQDRQLERHYHVVAGDADDFRKIARFLTGNAIGIALSGGGFKSYMQAGILHAMSEAGIPFDILGGSSGGAFAGASFAMAPPTDKVPELVREGMEIFKKVDKLTPPIVSLFSGKRFTEGFQTFFKEIYLEDLWVNYFCLSLGLVSGQIHIHQRGPLWEAVRASSSVMGLFPPVMINGDCLVDGGFINPCPTNILHQMGAGKIIVISAFGKAGITLDAYIPPTASGWNMLWKRINPFYRSKITPTIGTSIVQSMLMASDHLLKDIFAKSRIDLFIEPDLSAYTARDQSAVQKLYEFGYEYGRTRVHEWKETLGLT